MKPDYKNWIPKGMMFSLIAGTVLSLALLLVFVVFGIGVSGKLRVVLGVVFGVAFVVCAKYTEWCVYAYDGYEVSLFPVTAAVYGDGKAAHALAAVGLFQFGGLGQPPIKYRFVQHSVSSK